MCFLPLEQGTSHRAVGTPAARQQEDSVTVGFEHNDPQQSLGLELHVSPLFIVQQFPRAFSALVRLSDTARKHHPHGCRPILPDTYLILRDG